MTDGVTDNVVKEGSKDVVEKEVVEKGFLEKMKSVPSKVLDKVTNPDTIANLTLQAGGMLLATTMIPPGSMPELSPQEAQTLFSSASTESSELMLMFATSFIRREASAHLKATPLSYYLFGVQTQSNPY